MSSRRRRRKSSRKRTKRKPVRGSSRKRSSTGRSSRRKSLRTRSYSAKKISGKFRSLLNRATLSRKKTVKKKFATNVQRGPIITGSIKPFDEYPILGYKFDVVFLIDKKEYNAAFQSISGISRSSKTQKIQDGGDYESEYHLPSHFSYKDATFKRGVLRNFGYNRYPAYLQFWFETLGWLNTNRIETAKIQIHVKDFNKNRQRVTVETITLFNAYPTSVTLGELNSQKSEVLIETITLSFSKYTRTRDLVETPDSIGV